MVVLAAVGVGALGDRPAAAAVTTVWTEDFSGCSSPSGGTYEASGTATAKASGSPIVVDLYNSALLSCPGWTATGQAWMAVYRSGGSFPGSATRAAWLNESPSGSISRSLTGLTVGRQYRITADAWTDNKDAATALGLETSTAQLSMSMAAGTGVQQIAVSFCASSATETIRLFENGGSESSPVVTNITLEDMGRSCLDAHGDTMTVAPGGSGTVDVAANDIAKEGGSPPAGSVVTVQSGGTAGGTASFSGTTLTYVPLASEAGRTVTVKYRLCPPGETEGQPCSEGTVTITVSGGGGSGGGSGGAPGDLGGTGVDVAVLWVTATAMIAAGFAISTVSRVVAGRQRSR